MFWRASLSSFAADVIVLGPRFFSRRPTSFTLWGKGSPPDFVDIFLNIFNIVSFKRNVLHSSSKEQRTELLTIALALTAVPSTLFSRKVNSQVLIGQPSRGKMREAASSPFQDPSVGAEPHGPDLRGAPVPPGRQSCSVDRASFLPGDLFLLGPR